MTTEPPKPAADAAGTTDHPLAEGFGVVPERFWTERVHRMLETDPETQPLESRDDDGLPVRWLYAAEQELSPDPAGLPGEAPFVRSSRIGTAWDLRQEHGHPNPKVGAAEILEDLNGGVTSVGVVFDRAARRATSPASDEFLKERGRGGSAVSTVDDLDDLLEQVKLDLASIALDAGASAPAAAALLLALWQRRDHDLGAIRGSLGIDPVGALAADGVLHAAPQDAISEAARIAAEVAELAPHVQSLRVDTRAFVLAGATPVQELAVAAATGTAYLRACAGAGLAPQDAAARIEFQLTAGPVQFTEIAKLRAWRRIWARILEASGVAPDARRSPLYARATERMLSAADPWTNLLRGTTALFGAAAGGADGASVQPFDALRGQPGTLGRRMARNTQVILLEEAGLARVTDPAGGSWYVESRTDALAQAAWDELQRIEGAGGIVAELGSGALASRLREQAERRHAQLARREKQLTGINEFPLLGADGLASDRSGADLDAFAQSDRARRQERAPVDALASAAAQPTLAQLATLADAGARIDELVAAAGGAAHRGQALPVLRDAAGFEALRGVDGDDTSGLDTALHEVVVAPVGTQAQTVAPVTWARNWLAVGGLQAVLPEGDASAAGLVGERRTKIAVLCAGKGVDDDALAAQITELRDAGATYVVAALAGADRAAALGADKGVRDGDDMLEQLTELRELIEAGAQA